MFNTTIENLELQGSMAVNIGREDASGVRYALVDWVDKEQFVADILGGMTVEGETQVYRQPDTYPGYPYLFAIGANCEGQGLRGIDESGIIKYEKCRISITYGTIRDPSSGDSTQERTVYISESRSTGYEHQQYKSKNMYWLKTPITFYDLLTTGGRIPDNHVRGTGRVRAHQINQSDLNLNDPVGEESKARFVIPRMELNIDIHWWYNYPDDDFKIMMMLGTVNDDYYRPLLTTYPPQTLLLAGVNRQRQYTSIGISAWQISYKFLLNPYGWNTTFREEKWTEKEIPVIPGVPGVTVKTAGVDPDWPPGFYPIGTPGPGTTIYWPFRPANFQTNLLPHGFQPRDFGDGRETLP